MAIDIADWKYKLLHLSRDHVIKSSYNLVCYHSAMFSGKSYCRSAGISFLNLSRDHEIKRSHDFEVRIPPSQVTTLPSLGTIDIAEVQI